MARTEPEIFVEFAKVVHKFTGVPASEVMLEADLANDLGIDSMVMVEIIAATEDSFSVEIPDSALKQLQTVQDVVSYVRRVQRSDVSA